MSRDYSREEILSMEVGRELDALVAEKVMGWEWNDEKTFAHGNFINVEPPYAFDNESGEPHFNWSPSTDISAAWEVIEQFEKNTFNLNHLDNRSSYGEGWHCKLGDSHAHRCKTAPEAICKAALLAVME